DKAISRFEATLTSKRMATVMVPGLTSIIIPISGANDSARRCIESIRGHVEEPYEVIIIKSEKVKTPPWMEKLLTGDTCYTITGDPQATSYAPACNQALGKAAGQYVLILDMNTSMLKGTLTKMLECINRSPGYGIAIPASNCAIGIQQMPGVERLSLKEFEEYAPAFCRRNSHRRVITYEADCTCVLIKRSLIDTIGFFNEDIETPYFVVNDYRMRALVEGQHTVLAGDSCIYLNHEGPRQKGFDKVFHELWDKFDPNSEAGRKLSPHVAMKNARDHYGKGRLNEAVQAIMEGIKYTPEDGDLYYCLAEILLDAKLYDQAMEAMESLPENEKDSLRALEMLGYCSFYLGLAEEAGNYADRALSLSGDSTRTLDLKGLLAMASEDRQKAEAFFRQAIATDPCFANAYVNLGVLKWHGNGGTEALNLIEKGFILSPDTTDFSATYHSAVTALSEFFRAERVLLEALGLFPMNKNLSFLYIGTLLQQEKYLEAMKQTEKSMVAFGIDDGILKAALQIRDKVGPGKLNEPYRKGSLSVCMIVKNEEEQIAKCLMSLKPIADEIIVVDTGSTDKTKEISQALGAHVYDFPWTNDFSEARNFSMSKAKGQWILIHDADEVVSACDYEKLRRVLNQNTARPVAYSLITRNYSTDSVYEGWTANSGEYPDEEAGTGWFPSPKVRLLTNDGRFRFENPIHELLEPSLKRANVDIKSGDVVIHHYGQADPDRGQAKAEMYYLIGKKKLETDGNQEAALRELAVQARAIGKYDESIELWNRYLTVKPDHYLPYFNMSGCYFEKEDFDKAFQAAKKSFELNSGSKEAAQCYAVTSLFCGNGSEAVKSLENLLQTLPLYPTGKMTLAAAHCVTGMEEKGIQELTELKEMAYDCSEVLYNLSKKFIAAGKTGCAIVLLESMEKSGHVHPDSARLLQESYDIQAISSTR
ncbi:MAG: glycosyltransferase, partial [Syntrophorhabdaceae bacterium]|nr:glycosyltransferase [Syntrophorhabdaceae bacterium]